jgi:hypothetical protein
MARFVISGLFKDKAIKDAVNSLKLLTKQTKTFSSVAVSAYGAASAAAAFYAKRLARDSVQAALADEKSQRQLAFTLREVAGTNEAAAIAAEANIAAMSKMYGIADDDLRPALSALIRTTRSTSDAFGGLDLALSLSTATGSDLDTVVNALSRAYTGNFKGLKSLKLGIDEQKIASKDLKGILQDLREEYGGFAKNELNTTANQMARLKVASDEAKESIGNALLQAFMDIINSLGGVDKVVKRIEGIGIALADTITGVKSLVQGFKNFFNSLNSGVKALGVLGTVLAAAYKFGKLLTKITPWRLFGAGLVYAAKAAKDLGKQQRINAQIAANASRDIISARNAEYLALKKLKQEEDDKGDLNKKTLEQLMAEEAARKAGFKITEDIDSIQTVAAAKRLEESRQYKASVIDAAQAQFDAIKRNYDLLNSTWQVQQSAFDVFLAYLKSKSVNIPVNFIGGSMPSTGGAPSIGDVLPMQAPSFMGNVTGERGANLPSSSNQTINVTVNAGAIGSEDYLVGVIGDALTKYTRYGNTTAPAGFI